MLGLRPSALLNGVDLSIVEGQVVAILVANSAGKTTLARTICCEIVTT